jgi:hypothetical protein
MSLIASSDVNQTGASAGGNIAGRDVNTTVVHVPSAAGIVEQLLQKLSVEKTQDQQSLERIERLQRYYIQRAHDGVNGLEAKLTHGGRQASYME